MQPVSPRIVELLNEALTLELTVTNAYFLHARMLDAQGLPRLGKVFYDLSIGEMRDADALIQRILLFDAHPNLQRLGPVAIGETAEEMLRLGLEGSSARSRPSTRRRTSAASSATTARPPASTRWCATRRSTPTGSSRSSPRSGSWAPRRTSPSRRRRPQARREPPLIPPTGTAARAGRGAP